MMHRNTTTSEWTLMALESLMERGQLADWREFARALEGNERLARDALRVASTSRTAHRRHWPVCSSCSGFPVLLPAVASRPRSRILHHTLSPRCHHQLSRSGWWRLLLRDRGESMAALAA